MLNKNKKSTFKEFMAGNGFYMLTGIALIAVVVTAMVMPKKGNGNVAKEPQEHSQDQTAAEDISELRIPTIEPRMEVEDDLEESLEVSQDSQESIGAVQAENNEATDQVVQEVVIEDPEEEMVSETFSSTTASPEEIFHSDDDFFSWPVEERIIYGYSDNDVGSSFMNPTLDRTMRSFGLFLKTEEDAAVAVAAQGKVVSIANYPTAQMPRDMDYPQVGLAVIVDHGNDWKTVYGLHTGDATVKEGDIVQAGDIIGSVGKPSQDFSVTGSNLYFQVLKDDKPVNPKEILK